MASHHASEADSVASTPRSDQSESTVRFMCSFGGRILPRPHDNQLRYVGGETRIVSVYRSISFSGLQSKLSKLCNIPDVTLKYQLPNEDLDSLISVTTDEDLENMFDEYDRLYLHKSARLRLFLFPSHQDDTIGSLLDGSSKRESWFLDALNGRFLERGRSEVSSIVSDVPDYLFGFDANEKSRPLLSETVSVVSDPGSPAAQPTSSPYGSASSPLPDLPPVKTRPEAHPILANTKDTQFSVGDSALASAPAPAPALQPAGYPPNPVWHYVPEPQLQGAVPVYYVPAPMHPAAHYAHRVGPPAAATAAVVGQVPAGYGHPVAGQVYGTGGAVVRAGEGYEFATGVAQQQMYYAAPPGSSGGYTTAGVVGDMQGGVGSEMIGRVSQSH